MLIEIQQLPTYNSPSNIQSIKKIILNSSRYQRSKWYLSKGTLNVNGIY